MSELFKPPPEEGQADISDLLLVQPWEEIIKLEGAVVRMEILVKSHFPHTNTKLAETLRCEHLELSANIFPSVISL